jgi:cell wall-associated NlpC family hydrolase
MTKVVVFKGRGDPWHPTDATGFSKTGYVTNSGIVIYPRRSRIARTSIEAVTRSHHRLIDISKHPRAAQIEALFTNNVINNTLYVAAIQQIGNPNSPFWNNPIKIPILSPISPEEHETRWIRFVGALQKGDGIFTFDTKSIVSRIITHLDQGAWSHVGTYVGNGRIVEAITLGVVERSIEAYHDTRYRLNIYRFPGASPQQIDSMIASCHSTVGDRYSYRKVLLLGIRLALGIWPSQKPGASLLTRHATPNRIITAAGYDLIEIV